MGNRKFKKKRICSCDFFLFSWYFQQNGNGNFWKYTVYFCNYINVSFSPWVLKKHEYQDSLMSAWQRCVHRQWLCGCESITKQEWDLWNLKWVALISNIYIYWCMSNCPSNKFCDIQWWLVVILENNEHDSNSSN